MVTGRHRLAVAALCALSASLAVHSLVQDSATIDETDHLVSGFSYLATGDFRLASDHPPLARAWAALPAWLSGVAFRPEAEAWRRGDFWTLGREWLFVQNDPEALLVPARLMMVMLLLALDLAIYAAAHSVFGPRGGLLALFLAAFDPGLLAHGRLVTTDLPICLALLAALFFLARALARLEARRIAACALAFAALPLTKLSWPLVLPAALVMLGQYVVRGGRAEGLRRLVRASGLVAVLVVTAWLALWAGYGGRYSGFRDGDPGATCLTPAGTPEPDMETIWREALWDEAGRPKPGLVRAFVRFARNERLAPEPYLYGMVYIVDAMARRTAYLGGEHAGQGFMLYYPFLLAAKTPLPLLALMLAGLACLPAAWRRASDAGRMLVSGLVVLAVTVLLSAMAAPVNLGHRLVLPLEPPLLVLAGGAVEVARSGVRFVRAGLALALAGLAVATLAAHPHYLSDFNATVGGPLRAHAWFADSNLDWGQDLKRLAAFQRGHPEQPLYLAYFGSAPPSAYGVRARTFASYLPLAETVEFEPGLYVASLNQLLGVYAPIARDEFWDKAETREDYRALVAEAAASERPDAGLRLLLARARGGRLLQQLRRRAPDARIGHSLFAYRVDAAELSRLLAPPG